MKRMNASSKSRFGRVRSRGAALVEGSLLFPVMVMFLPYMAYFHNIHRAEFVQMSSTRTSVWAYTSISCTGSGTTAATTGSTDTTKTASNPGGVDSTGQGGKADGAPGVGSSNVRGGLVATAYATSTEKADAKPFNVTFMVTHTVKAESWNFCNEITVDPVTANVFSQVYNYATNLGKSMVPAHKT